MLVTVRLPGLLRPDAGGATTFGVEVGADATLADLFADLADRFPRLERRVRDEQGEIRRYVNVFVNGRECRGCGGLAAPLTDGGEVYILQSVAGG